MQKTPIPLLELPILHHTERLIMAGSFNRDHSYVISAASDTSSEIYIHVWDDGQQTVSVYLPYLATTVHSHSRLEAVNVLLKAREMGCNVRRLGGETIPTVTWEEFQAATQVAE